MMAAETTLHAVFQRSFQIYADRTAVTWEDGALTYRELGERSARFAAALHARGVRKGSRVAVLSETRPEYVVAYAALASLGATALTLNIRFHPGEITQCVEVGNPDAVLVSGGCAHLLEGVWERANIHTWVAWDEVDGCESYSDLLAEDQPAVEPDVAAEDIHNVLYTSGTTGRPKGAMISQRAAATRALRVAQWFGLGPDDGFVGWLPLFHCGGDEPLYATMLTGGTYATLRTADPEVMTRVIERDRLTWTLLLPGVITAFLDHPSRKTRDLTSFRFAIGYANMMPGVVRALTEAMDIDFHDAFGQTESSFVVAYGVSGPGEIPTMRKAPTPLLELRIVDEEMHELPVGVPGECVVRGPSVMSGYLDDAAATDEVFHGGWLHTGDLLVRNEDGTVSYVDRKKYLVKTGGENVYPAEVELAIADMPEVQEVCVFGVVDPDWGEAVNAVVVPRPDVQLTVDQVVDHCRSTLAGYKRPRRVEFLTSEEMPRSTTGKLQRHVLSERYSRTRVDSGE